MPPLAVIVVELPLHIVADPAVVVIVGRAFTVIVRVAVLEQPRALMPVTVYVAVAVPEKVTVAPVLALRLVAGDQL